MYVSPVMCMTAKTIAIATHKGGTGKTVTAMALGAALARAGRRTLLIDLDPQGHSGRGLGVDVENGAATVRDLLLEDGGKPVEAVAKPTALPHLELVPSTLRLDADAYRLTALRGRERRLLSRLEASLGRYDFIVIDCPPSLGVLTENALKAADFVIVPCLMEARASDALIDLVEVLRYLRGDSFDSWGILLTRFDPRKSLTNDAVMASLEPWRAKLFKTQIPVSEALNQAQMERVDIFSFAPGSKGAQAYEAFAHELLEHHGK